MITGFRSALLVLLTLSSLELAAIEVNKTAIITDTSTSLIGVNHIGLSVRDLDQALSFYQKATGFELLRRERVMQSATADQLFARPGVAYEVAVLKAPNMLFELTEFAHNRDVPITRIPPQGPGMTHTCFQSPLANPGWERFMAAGAVAQTTGGKAVDLGGYGVTYGYAYDPEGNMIELEQLDGEILARGGYDDTWQELGLDLWMSQVALATHDIDRLMTFYRGVLGFEPYRVSELENNEKADQILGIPDSHVLGGWFRMNQTSKVLEFWQYLSPKTPAFTGERGVTDPGYSFSLEVTDIHGEYRRLSELGLEFVSEPVVHDGFWQVYTRDIDGNVFALRQAIDPTSELSVRHLDRLSR